MLFLKPPLRRGLRRLPVDTLPVSETTHFLKGGAIMAFAGTMGALLFIGVLGTVALEVWNSLWHSRDRWMFIGSVVSVIAVGASFVLFGVVNGVSLLFRRIVLVLDESSVTHTVVTLSGAEEWTARVSEYEGIRFYAADRPTVSMSAPVFTLEMYHSKPERRVALFESFDRRETASLWARYCERLRLPAITVGEDGAISPAVR